jgi:hypothetical protein
MDPLALKPLSNTGFTKAACAHLSPARTKAKNSDAKAFFLWGFI